MKTSDDLREYLQWTVCLYFQERVNIVMPCVKSLWAACDKSSLVSSVVYMLCILWARGRLMCLAKHAAPPPPPDSPCSTFHLTDRA